ncbi:leucine-rich repeat domain-containing protein [Pseudobutyrivibrio ruminis]|uniref:leucine-rich repeat domain-containing protein n=1 Tax=Pseudobutyrivibrio ruminis TaxID=46206 RepID=UPI00051C2DCB|nr:leucine-rich repeat domain-containing protein [Pseudobutyrivibrio ruminis]
MVEGLLTIILSLGLFVWFSSLLEKKAYKLNNNSNRVIERKVILDSHLKYEVEITEKEIYAKVIGHIDFDMNPLLNIPERINGIPIVSIGDGAFENDNNIDTVNISNTIEEIGTRAFANSSIRKIIINEENSIRIIADGAFYWCKNLYIDMFCNLHNIYIGREAFNYVKLGDIVLNDTYEFTCGSFKGALIDSLKIDISGEELPKEAFMFSSVKSVHINGQTIKKICSDCFSGCSKLEKILIPDSVNYIDDDAFEIKETAFVHRKDGEIDLRYNPIHRSSITKAIFYCNAGSYAQSYAQNKKIKCRPYGEFFQ